MRSAIELNSNWTFIKDCKDISQRNGQTVDLPHTWNAKDGQDGGNDYFRGSCLYLKTLRRNELPKGKRFFLEINGANSTATVYINGKKAASHNGGYSTWRVDITDMMEECFDIVIAVDNSANDRVYPQMADFTFYGGIYRSVRLIAVEECHFELERLGGNGIKITPTVKGKDAVIEIKTEVRQLNGRALKYTVTDNTGKTVFSTLDKRECVQFEIKNVRLWDGKKDPHLYTCKAEIADGDEILDTVYARFGCRSFSVDAKKGFILNGREYPLRGVSRHQDRAGIGNALLPCHHRQDMDMILELGANTVRLAHYQHDQYFYDLCDEAGLIVWAEIPYISRHMPNGTDNTVSQLSELITQNYNHPSIAFWGLSNEITIGSSSDSLLENHQILNDLAHSMDKTRLTAVAALSACDINAPYLSIPDVIAFNHYFGWYGGDVSDNGKWFDRFHKLRPDTPIGCSEYGCEALDWHAESCVQGDYTEEYQTYYHCRMIKQLFKRKYIFASFVWNMFDFGADAREEGGENGINHKGLVTMDRQYKKDAFYAYKAWLSDEPFVHICGKRFVDRTESRVKIQVFSNQPQVELFVNGKSVGIQRREDHFFCFEINNCGESELLCKAADQSDKAFIRKVEVSNPSYVFKEKGEVLNWFDVNERTGYYSLNDKICDILRSKLGKVWFFSFGVTLKLKLKKAKARARGKENGFEGAFSDNKGAMKMIMGFTVLRLTRMLKMAGVQFSKKELLRINKTLNRIKKAYQNK